MNIGDISVSIGDTKLKIRVVCIVKTTRGFLFEKSDKDYIFVIGGKVSIGETLEEAVKREMLEEVGMRVNGLSLCSVVENLYKTDSDKIHEISFVYRIDDIFSGTIPEGFLEVSVEDLDNFKVQPNSIVGILRDETYKFRYIIVNEWKD